MSNRDHKSHAQAGDHDDHECQTNSTECKSEPDSDVQHLSASEFCELWNSGTSFDIMPPNATLSFQLGEDYYQMFFKVPAVTQSVNAPTVLIHADTFDPSASFTKNGLEISRDVFMTASEAPDKTNISLLIDSDPWDTAH